jgi:serine/threonine protein kinase
MLMNFSHDVANGMQFLAINKIMHGDLAARNVLVDETKGYVLVAKVSDFGLSKQFHDNISYKFKEKKEILPWSWFEFEVFFDGLFTLTSVVWSYGVLIWEIMSLGELPYYRRTLNEVIELLRNGYRLPCPTSVNKFPDWPFVDFYDAMSKMCFDERPLKRACFSEILNLIESYIPNQNVDICVAKGYKENLI